MMSRPLHSPGSYRATAMSGMATGGAGGAVRGEVSSFLMSRAQVQCNAFLNGLPWMCHVNQSESQREDDITR